MLRLARVRRCGERSFSPRNDGPLIDGEGCAAGALRGASAVSGRDGSGAGEVGMAEAGVAGRCSGLAATGGADSSAAPHMPQKRLPSGFSLPQREQRTHPPSLYFTISWSFDAAPAADEYPEDDRLTETPEFRRALKLRNRPAEPCVTEKFRHFTSRCRAAASRSSASLIEFPAAAFPARWNWSFFTKAWDRSRTGRIFQREWARRRDVR